MKYAEALFTLVIVGIVLRNPTNFSDAIGGLATAYQSFVKGLAPGGIRR